MTTQCAGHDTERFALGVGCERGISALGFERGVLAVLTTHGLSLERVSVLASIDNKANEPALLAFAAKYRLATRFYSAAQLEARAGDHGHANPSEQVKKHVATRGVSEPAALLAAGADTLWVAKTICSDAATDARSMTVAIARIPAGFAA